MSILQVFEPNEFFKEVGYQEFTLGQVCWVPTPILDPIPRILDVERNSATDHDKFKFELREGNREGDFRKRDRSLPIKNLNLRSNEELLTQRAKKRPAIIISNEFEWFPEISTLLKQRGKKHLQENCMFVVPCYGVQKDEFGSGFPPEMVARIQCLLYRQFFFLPSFNSFTEAVVRFDRIQTVIEKNPAAIKPTNICLSDDMFSLMLSSCIYCLSGKSDDLLRDIREILQGTYPD